MARNAFAGPCCRCGKPVKKVEGYFELNLWKREERCTVNGGFNV